MITVEHLTKKYGAFTAVDDLSFQIDSRGVYGFLGPNGAGKSTTMNIMTGCLSATDGHVRIGGHDIFDEPNKAKGLIGYLPEQPPLYMNETPAEYLRFVGEAKGIRRPELTKQIGKVLEQTKTWDVKDKLLSRLSKGYRQRVGIAQALLGDPEVIILDEPTVGLDPLQIIEIRDLIRQLGQTHTVILSSHILSEVQTICEKVLIISRGRLIAFDEPGQLEKLLLSSNEITFLTDASEEEVRGILGELSLVPAEIRQDEENGYLTVRVRPGQSDTYDTCRALFFAFAGRQRALLELTAIKANLEDVFIELTENDNSAGKSVGGRRPGEAAGEAPAGRDQKEAGDAGTEAAPGSESAASPGSRDSSAHGPENSPEHQKEVAEE